MKRDYEDPSLELIGRSAAERRLDRFYNKQRSKLPKRETTLDSAKRAEPKESKALPFQSTSEKAASAKAVSPECHSERKKGFRDILLDIATNHLPRKNRFAKSLQLLTKLSVSYLDDRNNKEFIGIDLTDLIRVYADLDRSFISHFSGSVPRDSLDVKAAIADFLDKVVDRLEKDPTTAEDVQDFLNLIKLSMGYAAALWHENDSFRFHGIMSQLEGHFNRFESGALQADCFPEDNSNGSSDDAGTQPEHQENGHNDNDEAAPYASTERSEQERNKVTSAIETSDASSDDMSYSSLPPTDQKQIPTVTSKKYRIPSGGHLLELQKQAFVRTLAVVFGFYSFSWAKVSIETFFQRIYLKRDIFPETEQRRISEWQQSIKASKAKTFKGVQAMEIAQAKFAVQDAREEKITSIHGSQVWCNRQYGI